MDLIDLADPIRLLILLLPERYRGPAAALITVLVAAQGIAASTVSRLPLAAAQHPRWGRVVRALHWYSLLRFRDEKGTTKAIGADLAPRVTVAPLPSRPLVVSLDAATRPEVSVPFDPTARQTIVPDVAAQIASETLPRDPSQRGSISLRALVALALLALVALAASCIPARRFVLDHTDGVPARVACTPRRQACLVSDAGVFLPVVYSDECRPWPTLPMRPDGTQRTCAPGEGCAVDGDSGIARCTAADASVSD